MTRLLTVEMAADGSGEGCMCKVLTAAEAVVLAVGQACKAMGQTAQSGGMHFSAEAACTEALERGSCTADTTHGIMAARQ